VSLDEREIENQYSTFCALVETFTPDEAVQRLRTFRIPEEVIERIVARHRADVLQVRLLDEPHSVVVDNRMTWYGGPRPGDVHWPAVERMLRARVTPKDLMQVDQASTKIVGMLDHPYTPSFRTYGLVVGYVQSGKTTNFTAVMAKAADRRYRLFIVLSGVHNALRRQTQVRIHHDLVAHNRERWYEMTTPEEDFRDRSGAAAYFSARNQHTVLVVKKNAAVLRKLARWLEEARPQLENCPTLIIDDEADQSTIATARINPLLARVMKTFPKVAYIGYTATPFANLLTDPANREDFYPRHFVVNLPRSDGYYGPEVLFGRDILDNEDAADVPGGYDMMRQVPAEEVGRLRPPPAGAGGSTFQPAVTPSLATAIEYFVLATAARRVRARGNPHSTMLLHTTVQTVAHSDFQRVVDEFRRELRADLEAGRAARLASLRATWESELRRVPAAEFDETPVAFDDLLSHAAAVAGETRVIVDNSRSRDRLDYESSRVTAIAIGGNTLSRGLTLEGLVVSFFVRAVSAYDTLLQMGRWFGYRDGYADLPRIWLTDELNDWFRHLATVEAEMRRDIDRYMVENVTPEVFAVRIRNHRTLAITAAAKMKNAVRVSASYGGQLVETRYFKVGQDAGEWLSGNERAARDLVARARETGTTLFVESNRACFADVPVDAVTDFIATYEFHEKSYDCRRRSLLEYIAKRNADDALLRWDVGIIGSRREGARRYNFGADIAVGMVTRARLAGTPDHAADIKTLTSRRDELVGLRIDTDVNKLGHRQILDLRQEQRPGVGLVLLYPIDPLSETTTQGRRPLAASHGVVMGVAFIFPEPPRNRADSTVEYEYYSADLSNLYVEEDDVEALEGEEEE
jgi:molybdopterin-guanine dinucleotide biosynthesis protein